MTQVVPIICLLERFFNQKHPTNMTRKTTRRKLGWYETLQNVTSEGLRFAIVAVVEWPLHFSHHNGVAPLFLNDTCNLSFLHVLSCTHTQAGGHAVAFARQFPLRDRWPCSRLRPEHLPLLLLLQASIGLVGLQLQTRSCIALSCIGVQRRRQLCTSWWRQRDDILLQEV